MARGAPSTLGLSFDDWCWPAWRVPPPERDGEVAVDSELQLERAELGKRRTRSRAKVGVAAHPPTTSSPLHSPRLPQLTLKRYPTEHSSLPSRSPTRRCWALRRPPPLSSDPLQLVSLVCSLRGRPHLPMLYLGDSSRCATGLDLTVLNPSERGFRCPLVGATRALKFAFALFPRLSSLSNTTVQRADSSPSPGNVVRHLLLPIRRRVRQLGQ
jgi:hypothetical protein